MGPTVGQWFYCLGCGVATFASVVRPSGGGGIEGRLRADLTQQLVDVDTSQQQTSAYRTDVVRPSGGRAVEGRLRAEQEGIAHRGSDFTRCGGIALGPVGRVGTSLGRHVNPIVTIGT